VHRGEREETLGEYPLTDKSGGLSQLRGPLWLTDRWGGANHGSLLVGGKEVCSMWFRVS
jgi:hypothetical protein